MRSKDNKRAGRGRYDGDHDNGYKDISPDVTAFSFPTFSSQEPFSQHLFSQHPLTKGPFKAARTGLFSGFGSSGAPGITRQEDVYPSVAGRSQKGVFSAIDLGTNNCRLLVARPTPSGFRVIDAFSRIVRLGEGLAEHGRLSDQAMDRAVEALKVCANKIRRRRVTCMRHVATEALRVASNTDAFIERVRQETDITLEVISSAEEARLAVLGCQTLIAPNKRHVLVFDIGGGSTELIWVRVEDNHQLEIKGWMSIPYGVVNLTETHRQASDQGCRHSYQQMIDKVAVHLQAFEEAYGLRERLKNREVQFLGTSGTVTTLASLHLQLPKYDREQIDGAWMKSVDISKLSRRVASMSEEERAQQPCIGQDRCDLVVAGCAILEALLNMWPVDDLRVADRGIREGILRGLMEEKGPILSDSCRQVPNAIHLG